MKFRRIPIEITAKVVERNTVLPTKRGVLTMHEGELLTKEFGEWHVYPVHALLRGYEPMDEEARSFMESLKEKS